MKCGTRMTRTMCSVFLFVIFCIGAGTAKASTVARPTRTEEQLKIEEEKYREDSEKYEREKAEIEAMGGFDKLMETLKKRLEEQKGRHQGHRHRSPPVG